MLDLLRLLYKQEVDETEHFQFSLIVYNKLIKFIFNIIYLYLTLTVGLSGYWWYCYLR